MSLATGNNSIDSLVYSSWASRAGTPVQLTYSFMQAAPANGSTDDLNGFRAMTATQQQAARDALALWADVANVSFREVTSNGNIQFGTNNQGTTSSGYAYLPDGRNPTYLFTNNQDRYNSAFTPGTYGPTVLLHEIGHTLGLKHPGNYDSVGNGNETGPFLPSSTDNGDYTVMSYTVPSGYDLHAQYNVTPMLYDIQAAQYLYGANLSYHTGNDTYSFSNRAAPQCIWDAGGSDTLDFSSCNFETTINLNAGTFSSTEPGFNNVSIAYNVTIERAIAGSGGSTIICNNAGDTITGGIGADVITAGAGSDRIDAGGGSDTVIFTSTLTHYVLGYSGGQLTIVGDGTDILTGVEFLRFDDGTVNVAELPQTTAVTIANQTAHTGTAFKLALDPANEFSTAPGTTLHLSAKLSNGLSLPAWLTFDSQTGVFSGTPASTDVGSLTVRVSASTGSFGAVSEDFKLVVSATGSTIQGGAGNDTLTAGAGDNAINGGAGIDTVVFSGVQANFSIKNINGALQVVDLVGNGGLDTLSSVERLQFTDGSLAVDTSGAAGELYRMYEAMFQRAPDASGAGFWLTQLDRGAPALAIASSFINSAEFIALYGANTTDSAFITSLYSNVLHRTPDGGGFAFWQEAFTHGATRADMLVAFADSAENVANTALVIPVGIPFIPYHG